MELFVESLTRNIAETTASSPFMYIFLATNRRQGIDGDIEIMSLMCVQNMTCFKTLMMLDLSLSKPRLGS